MRRLLASTSAPTSSSRAALASLRLASSSRILFSPADPTSSSAAAAQLSEEKAAFLKTFREKLAQDPDRGDLDEFVLDAAEAEHAEKAASGEGLLREKSVTGASVGPLKRGRDPLPPWLKLKLPKGATHQPRYNQIRRTMREKGLATVCEEAKCPNIGECWGGGTNEDGEDGAATATIMLMGAHCTRGCRFCSVLTSRTPPPLDPLEPEKTADAVNAMGVDYIVLTMVDRDDLPDAGANHVARCITEIKAKTPELLMEALVGDFNGRFELVETVANSGLNVYAHNIECVERITPNVRDRRATYKQSMKVLEHASTLKGHGGIPLITKSSIMLGLGETEAEIRQTMRDLRNVGVSAVTLGQYLQPSRTRLKVSRYAHPTEFEMWEKEAKEMGFVYCASGPMVRSSYRAGEYYLRNVIKKRQEEQAMAAAAAANSAA